MHRDGLSLDGMKLQAAKDLAAKTGITETQAMELVRTLGLNTSSLIFHANQLKAKGS
ncbi:hypothetical protein ABMA32_10065 [Mesorhizobium sp. VNQ89]|uniref:hypothetical protein n=1 Tax=Mesorhizobium quangtriensis TaxID=3157709 RepID=UPI0032B719C3